MAITPNHQHPSTGILGSPTRLVGLMATAGAALLLVLSMTMMKAGAQTVTTYPPVTEPPTTIVDVIPGGGDDGIIEASEPVQFVVDGFEPGTVVTLTITVDTNGDGILEEIVLTGVADENGEVTFDWNVPAGTSTGDYAFEVEGIDDVTGLPRTESGSIHIEAVGAFVPGDGTSGPLPYTGSNSTNLLRIGLVLIVAGGISVVAVRRRNAHTNA